MIKVNEKLVGSLGIDTSTGKLASDRAEFERASTELTEAAKTGLSVVARYAEKASGLWFAKDPVPTSCTRGPSPRWTTPRRPRTCASWSAG